MSTGQDIIKKKTTLWMLVVLVVVIVLTIIFAGKDKNQEDLADINSETEEILSSAMEPVQDDTYTYQFEGIDWQFPVEDQGVRVNFMLENFSRTEGAIVTFGNPYKLGFYEGECSEVESISYDQESVPGIPISYAECVAPNMTSQFVLFQQGEEIVAKLRRMYKEIEGAEDPQFVTLYTVNLTEIVQ